MRLTRLKIIRYDWCAPAELFLGAKRQLVLGKNGTGKTKLLELIARVCAGDLPWLMAEPIEFEADWSVDETSPERTNGAVSGVLRLTFSCEHRPMQQHSERAPLIDYGRSPGPKVQFRLTFEASPESMLKDLDWQCSHGQVTASNGVGGLLDVVRNATIWDNTIGKYTNHLLSGTGRFSLDELAMYSLLLGLHAVRRYDEVGGELRALLNSELRAFDSGPEDNRETILVFWGSANMKWLFDQIPNQPLGTGELDVPAAKVDFLRSFFRITEYGPKEVSFRFVRSQVENGTRVFIYDEPRIYLRLPKDGHTISDKDLSFGEKRALSFLAYLNSGTGNQIIIADELMNGLHHSLGVALLNEIGDRQAFLATHEPVLMDNIDFQSADELRRSLIHCERNPDPKEPPFIWSQIDETKAARIFHQYDVASIKHGHELLQDWGIW